METETLPVEEAQKKEIKTPAEFDQALSQINFGEGTNVATLDDYLLACLAQLDSCKNEPPSYHVFLKVYNQARNGPKAAFDKSWKALYDSDYWTDYKWESLSERDRVIHGLRSLATDLINTREVRSQSGYEGSKTTYDWDTEGGIRFYNGTTPDAILSYAATRFEGEYQPSTFEERAVTWDAFMHPIWVGISYE